MRKIRGLIIEQMRANAIENNNILCLQDAIHSVNLYSSAMIYFMEKFPVFVNIKGYSRNNNSALMQRL